MPIDISEYEEFYALGISDKMRQMLGNKCEFCGVENHSTRIGWNGEKITVVLTVHHKDHNPKNNSRDNLLLLCQKCHMKMNFLRLPKEQATVNKFIKINKNIKNIKNINFIWDEEEVEKFSSSSRYNRNKIQFYIHQILANEQ
jgi:hypothetical protein